MKEQKKKRLIAVLLLVSCFISGYMLFTISEGGARRLRNLAQADSLIHQELADFNISEKQVTISNIRVDSNFKRKNYYVGLPYRFSKTQFHAELNNLLHEYGIKTPAKVTFPEKNVDIHLLYNNTVIRSISLQTDPDLSLERNEVSVLMAFEDIPDRELIDELTSLGEPIPIVIKIENPIQANELRKQLGKQYNRIVFWLQNSNGQDLMKASPREAIAKLRQVQDVLPEARILQFPANNKTQQELVTKTDLTFINASNALLLHEGQGKASFFEGLHKLQAKPSYSMTVITGNETTLTWLKEKLPELKKAGINIVPPPQTNY